mmetsp:Transcript_15641/g.11382  ORF Transcript_15641/g.11382 Transcript_15641/m.11382 type:complete len:96 (+) Transcript_15641:37-324(+)
MSLASTNSSFYSSGSAVEIILNVYDLGSAESQQSNAFLFNYLGLGFFHSAIEINGTEYCYGGNPLSSGSGVFTCAPMTVENAHYRESFLMGTYRN